LISTSAFGQKRTYKTPPKRGSQTALRISI
jgi:hypothetical protein